MASNFALMLLILSLISIHLSSTEAALQPAVTNITARLQARKLSLGIDRAGPEYGEVCSKDVILVYQGPTPPLPSGIPEYTVEIYNVCISGDNDTGVCDVSNIHLTCEWFASASTIDPSTFRRLAYDDCLVNDGQPMKANSCITFTYANSFPYPMQVKSVSC